MQIKLSLAVCDGTVESDPQALLTMELDSHPSIETLGLSLANGKAALVRLQAEIVKRQVELMSTSQRRCDGCGLNRAIKDFHDVHYRSLFGRVVVRVPRWRRCACTARAEIAVRRRWISAELEYVQSRLAATMPYAKSAQLLELLLPVTAANAPSTVREHTLEVGRRLDAQGVEALPEEVPVASKSHVTTVGLDGGYLRFATPTRRNRSRSSPAAPCALASVSAAWRSFERLIHARTRECKVSWQLSADKTCRWRSSPTATSSCASGSSPRCPGRGISWTGTTCENGWASSTPSCMAGRRPAN